MRKEVLIYNPNSWDQAVHVNACGAVLASNTRALKAEGSLVQGYYNLKLLVFGDPVPLLPRSLVLLELKGLT